MDIQEKIAAEVKEHPVVVYMKGTPNFPQCGFSGAVIQMLKGVGAEIFAVDVLGEEGYRDGIKKFSNWPTIPQVYIGGKFVGGCDIARELFESGELKRMVEDASQ